MQKTPPRYVPTLTQVVSSEGFIPVADTVDSAAQHALQAVNTDQMAKLVRDHLMASTHAYIQQEMSLRLRELSSRIALEHVHRMMQELQPQLETMVQNVVQEAVAHAVKQVAKEPTIHAP